MDNIIVENNKKKLVGQPEQVFVLDQVNDCMINNIEYIILLTIGLCLVFLLYIFLYNKNNIESMGSPTDEYMLEQMMFKNLKDSEKQNYLNMDLESKKKYFKKHT